MSPDIDALLSSLEKRSLNSVLFNLAHAYARASDKSWSAIFSENDADFMAPAIMCQSFAVELLLKFFIIIDHPDAQTKADLDALGINTYGHPYSKLWDRIASTHKKNIAESFSSISGQRTNEAKFREILVQIGDEPCLSRSSL